MRHGLANVIIRIEIRLSCNLSVYGIVKDSYHKCHTWKKKVNGDYGNFFFLLKKARFAKDGAI